MRNIYKFNWMITMVIILSGTGAFAQFSGSYAPANWTFANTAGTGDGSVATTGAPCTIVLSGNDNGAPGCCDQNVSYGITLCSAGIISFDYSHSNPDWDEAYYAINGTRTAISIGSGSGSMGPIAVNAGDLFQFLVVSHDNCCGRGVLTISNFSGPACCTNNFAGIFAPANWTFSNTAASDGSVNVSGAPASIVLNGNDDGAPGCCDQHVTYGITIAAASTVSFNYNHSNPDWDEAYYAVNGARTAISVGSGSGTMTVSVNAGDLFEFLVVSHDNCCGRGVLTISNFSVCANHYVAPTVPSITPNLSICAGSTATLAILSGTLNSATNWEWTTGSCGGTVVGTGMSITVSPSTTTTYYARGNTNCGNCASVTVTVNSLPTVTANSTASAVCAGSNVTLTGAGATTYTWDNGVTDGVAFAPAGTTTYMVTGTDGNGCVNTASTSVTVNSLPTVTANSTASAVCAGSNVTLTGAGATTYTWDNGVTDGVAFAPAGTTTYMVTGTDGNGCVNTASTSVTVNSLPIVSYVAAVDSVCADAPSFALSGGSPSGGSYSGTGVSGGIFDPAVSGAGIFTVTYTFADANSCSASSTQNITVSTCLGIESAEHANEFVVFPNPTNGILNVQMKNATAREFTISILDIQGKIVYRVYENSVGADYHKEISLTDLAKGMYYLKLETVSNVTVQKVILQ